VSAALVFDFDGLVLDTESAEYESVRSIYRDHGQDLPLEAWLPVVGTVHDIDWVGDLEGLTGLRLDRRDLVRLRRRRAALQVEHEHPRPGVVAALDAADRLGVPCAIASNAPRRWIDGHLDRLGLAARFAAIRAVDDVAEGKPAPDVYLAACAAVGADPARSIAFEDSPVGARAALAAGMTCVAVPSPLTRHLEFPAGVHRVASLEDVDVDALLTGARP
jgi:HAD superfamily hydrolase (TIGR01509 family)